MLDLYIFVGLILLGFIFGQMAEKRHFRSIIKREKKYGHILAFCKRYPISVIDQSEGRLVGGSVVISVDFFKRFVAGLRSLVGGRVNAYESLLDRARREALLRMKEDAIKHDIETIVNVKLETSSITKGQANQVGAVEVYAYGTGLRSLKQKDIPPENGI